MHSKKVLRVFIFKKIFNSGPFKKNNRELLYPAEIYICADNYIPLNSKLGKPQGTVLFSTTSLEEL